MATYRIIRNKERFETFPYITQKRVFFFFWEKMGEFSGLGAAKGSLTRLVLSQQKPEFEVMEKHTTKGLLDGCRQ